MSNAETRRPPRHARNRLALAIALTTTIVAVAAWAAQPALADRCSGTLVPAGGDTARYTLICDVPIEGHYTVTAVAANGGPMPGTMHGTSQGFACAASTPSNPDEPEDAESTVDEDPQASEPEPFTWDCSEGSAAAGEPIEGLFTAEQNPCAASLTLWIATYEQAGSSTSPLTQTALVIGCPNEGGGSGYGSGGREGVGSSGRSGYARTPTISAVRVYPSSFKAAKRGGGHVSYRLSASARITFTLERVLRGVKRGRRCLAAATRTQRGGCTRRVKVAGNLARYGSAGPNTLRFTGVLAGHRLAPGAYLFVMTARSGSGSASPAVHSPQFHVVP